MPYDLLFAAKKDGLEHKYEYKAAVRFQQKGMAVVSGNTEAVSILGQLWKVWPNFK